MIPSAEPLIRSADDWEARFETVRSTFSSRVGQICNAALNRSIVAYNENSDDGERQRLREETELLAILTGLEIDSAKSGVRPDLDEYLGRHTVPRTPFLQYKGLLEQAESRRAWYEPTHAKRMKTFFASVNWDRVDSNLERLPYLFWTRYPSCWQSMRPASPASGPAARSPARSGGRATSNASSTAGGRRTSGTQTSCTPG